MWYLLECMLMYEFHPDAYNLKTYLHVLGRVITIANYLQNFIK